MGEKKFYEEKDFKKDLEKLKKATEELKKLADLKKKVDMDLGR